MTDDAAYLRYPHLHSNHLCFVAEDDLWLAALPAAGEPSERAWRLTVDRTRVGHPRFSPDGSRIAFTTWRSLDPEVHLVPVEGGPARQLTYWGATDTRVCGWTPEGDVLAVASHGEPFAHRAWSYRIPVEGPDGPPAGRPDAPCPGSRLPWGPVSDIAVAEQEGERRTLLLTGTPPHEPASWKRYRGGATGRMWLQGERLLPGLEGHLDAVMLVGGRVAFLSDHEGVGNLYSCLPDGSDLRRHTDHDTFYARHAATDGRRVVYQCAGELWLVDDFARTARPRRLDVRLGGQRTGRRPYQVPASAHLDGLAVDHTGRASAVAVRGSLYWLTHRDGPARAIADAPGVRSRLPEMLGGTGRIAYVTDADGEDAIEIADLPRASRQRPAYRVAGGRLGRVLELVAAPSGERLAVVAHDGRLLIVDVPDLDEDTSAPEAAITEVVRSHNGPVHDPAFSPDSRWLAWAHPGVGRSLSCIRLAKVADWQGPEAERTILDVTDGRFEDEQPVFTRDGRYLAFLSWRGFDPVYDVHTGDLSFPLGCRPYLVPLASATLSPFALTPEGRPAAGGLDPQDRVGAGGDEDGPEVTVLVEAEGLANRVTPFPVTASKYTALCPVAGGGLIWLRFPISGALGETFVNPADTSGRPTLEHFDLTTAKRTELTSDIDWFALSGDGTRLVVADEGILRVVPAEQQADSDSTTYIDMRRVLHDVDPAAEWRQAYAEAGRLIRAYFWDPGMSGVDWDAVLDQYRPLVERVASPDEFADLLREVLGELGTSHAYVTPARRDEGPPHYQRPIGFLGADLIRTPEGDWQIGRILPGDSSDSRARSPLAASPVREGALLTHVDARPVDLHSGPAPLLAAAGGTTVELTLEQAGPRRVAVVPLIDERPLRYQDWVARRRAVVRELSGGECGYLHIPDMGGSGWAQFNRDLRLEVSRPALIVDVRGNAGGHISELVLEKLTRTILGWDLTRNAEPVSYASNAPRGPVVAVADEATASDGDMIIAAFRQLGLGPVVGARTWGGVVGMTGRHRLGDGTVITVPMNAAWFEGFGWSVENRGVDPDIEVLRTPLDWAEGRSSVLGTAVTTALDLLERHPARTPPGYGDVPDRSRPPLPPRP
ncbi:S41 family peptidase [Streptomyces tubbatahanensis]|uniref:Tricorn protease homolog n=1 Tax=Streptomyces tubbatahanensis TaxID=2923272 RepID=A0ABY3XSS0_9ACTN|nr:S41 family peptidase [Streptomyces tubbatahanensis]UNS97473.1 S41 family peptidase [Streptomyces tubbatahanensis]